MSEPLPSAVSDNSIHGMTAAALLAQHPADPLLVGNLPRPLARRLNSARGTRRHLRAIRILLNGMLLLALLYTVTLTKALLIPLVLAAFIGLALNPLVAVGARFRLPRWLTACVLMTGLMFGIVSGVGALAQPAMGWFQGAPAAIRSFVPKFRDMTKPLEAANRATQTLVNGSARVVKPASPALQISAWDVVSTAPKILAAVLSVFLLVFFFLIYGDTMLRRLVELTPSFAYKRHAVSIVRGFQTEISRYLLTALLINGTLGAITAGMLWLYKVPDPMLWGAVA
ncbi:MAG: AI-2E family transporter, partial [Rhodanobacter sp.]